MHDITAEDLPALPDGAQVTAWQANLPEGLKALTPRMAMVLLLHVSWLRSQEYAAMLKKQVDADTRTGGVRGLVGHRTAASKVTDGLYPTSEEIRALVQLEGRERDRCARLARDAHEIGITDGGVW
jgi:hypothetical protein